MLAVKELKILAILKIGRDRGPPRYAGLSGTRHDGVATAPRSTRRRKRRDLVERNPDLVQRFVDGSIIGWYNYIYGDNSAANAMIKRENPDMTDDLLAYSVAKMKEYGIVDSGDSLDLGVGAMTDAHMQSFFDKMVRAGVVKPAIDYRRAYTLRFVDKKVGIDLRHN